MGRSRCILSLAFSLRRMGSKHGSAGGAPRGQGLHCSLRPTQYVPARARHVALRVGFVQSKVRLVRGGVLELAFLCFVFLFSGAPHARAVSNGLTGPGRRKSGSVPNVRMISLWLSVELQTAPIDVQRDADDSTPGSARSGYWSWGDGLGPV